MPIRLSGMVSGLDTDAIVKELISAQSQKKEKYEKAETKLEWNMSAWKSLNTKVYSFYTSSLSQMRLSSSYNKKSSSIEDTNAATVTASNKAVNGTQTLSVESLAKTGYLTGGKLSNDNSIKGDTKLSALGIAAEGNINVKVDGKETLVSVNADTTINSFVSSLKNAGLNASFDETNQRMFISSKTSGSTHDFSLTGDSDGITALKALNIYSVSDADKASYTALSTLTATDFTKSALNEFLDKKIQTANQTLTTQNQTLSAENTNTNKKIAYASLSDENKVIKNTEIDEKITAETEVFNTKKTELDTKLAAGDITQEEYDGLLVEAGKTLTSYQEIKSMYQDVDAEIDATTPAEGKTKTETYVANEQAKIVANNTTITANNTTVAANNKVIAGTYDTANILTMKDSSGNNWIDAAYESDPAYTALYSKYEKITTDAQNVLSNWATQTASTGSVRINGTDSKIWLNGAEFTSNTNNFSINGLTISAKAVSAKNDDGSLKTTSVTTSTDVDGIYNMVKGFLKGYNDLIKEMEGLFNADSAKGYEPLTDTQKESMSDDEVTKWEKKIKDSLLRRDDNLSGIMTAMKSSMSQSFNINGESFSLSTLGIGTLSYFSAAANEKGVYHIDGDTEDSSTSGKSDKLREAITNNQDDVVSFLSQLSQGLYSTLTKKMASSSLSSAYTIYNDKAMASQQKEYKTAIEEWEDKISEYEDKYYKQFSSMESAMSTLQSSSSYLSQLMG